MTHKKALPGTMCDGMHAVAKQPEGFELNNRRVFPSHELAGGNRVTLVLKQNKQPHHTIQGACSESTSQAAMDTSRLNGGYSTMSLPALSATCTSPEPQFLGSEASWATCAEMTSPTEQFRIHRAPIGKSMITTIDQASVKTLLAGQDSHGSLQKILSPGKQSPLATLAATWGVKLPKAVGSSQRLKQVHNICAVDTAWLPEPLSPHTMSPTDTLSAGLSAYKVHLPAGLQPTRRHMVLKTEIPSRSRSAGRLTGHTNKLGLKKQPTTPADAESSAAWQGQPEQVAVSNTTNNMNAKDGYLEPTTLPSVEAKDDHEGIVTTDSKVLKHTDSSTSAAAPEVVMQLLASGVTPHDDPDSTADQSGHMERLLDELVVDAACLPAATADILKSLHEPEVNHGEAGQGTNLKADKQAVSAQERPGKQPHPSSNAARKEPHPKAGLANRATDSRPKVSGSPSAYKAFGPVAMITGNKKTTAGKLPQVVKQQRNLRSTVPARSQPLPTIKPKPTSSPAQRSNYYPSMTSGASYVQKASVAEPSPLLLPALRGQIDAHTATVKPNNATARLEQKLQQKPPPAPEFGFTKQETEKLSQAGQIPEDTAMTTDSTGEAAQAASIPELYPPVEPCGTEAVLSDVICTVPVEEPEPSSDSPAMQTIEHEHQQLSPPEATEDTHLQGSLPVDEKLGTSHCQPEVQEACVHNTGNAEEPHDEQHSMEACHMTDADAQHYKDTVMDSSANMQTADPVFISPVHSCSGAPQEDVIEQPNHGNQSTGPQLSGLDSGQQDLNEQEASVIATNMDPNHLMMTSVTPLDATDNNDNVTADVISCEMQQAAIPLASNDIQPVEPNHRRVSQQRTSEMKDTSKSKAAHLSPTLQKRHDNKPVVNDQRRQPRAVRESLEVARSSIPSSGVLPPSVSRARARRGSMPTLPTQATPQPPAVPQIGMPAVTDIAVQDGGPAVAPAMPAYRARRASVPIMPSQMSGFMLMAATKTDVFIEGLTAVEPTNLMQIAEVRQAQEAVQVRKTERRKSRLQSNTSSTAGYEPQSMQKEGAVPADNKAPRVYVYSSDLYAMSGMLDKQQPATTAEAEAGIPQVEQGVEQEPSSVKVTEQQTVHQGQDNEFIALQHTGSNTIHELTNEDHQPASAGDTCSHGITEELHASHDVVVQAADSHDHQDHTQQGIITTAVAGVDAQPPLLPDAAIGVVLITDQAEEITDNNNHTEMQDKEGVIGAEFITTASESHPQEQITSAELMAAVMAAEPEVFQEGQDAITSVEGNYGHVHPKQSRMQTILSDELLAPMPVNPDAFRQSLGEPNCEGYVELPPRRKGSKQLKHKSSGRSVHSKGSANLEAPPKAKVRFEDMQGSEASLAKQSQKAHSQSEVAIDRAYSQALTGFEDVLDDYEWEAGKPSGGNMQNKPDVSGGKAGKQEKSRLHKSNRHNNDEDTPEHSSGSQTLAGFEDILENSMFADEELVHRHRTNKAQRRRK